MLAACALLAAGCGDGRCKNAIEVHVNASQALGGRVRLLRVGTELSANGQASESGHEDYQLANSELADGSTSFAILLGDKGADGFSLVISIEAFDDLAAESRRLVARGKTTVEGEGGSCPTATVALSEGADAGPADAAVTDQARDLPADRGADRGHDAGIKPDACVPHCKDKPCGSPNGCGGACSAGSGCCSSECNKAICGAKNECGQRCTGENNDSCAGVRAETWRCVYSAHFGTNISQVCRGGKWVTYHTSPNNCAACCGNPYPGSACD